jgi:hypothetical protein
LNINLNINNENQDYKIDLECKIELDYKNQCVWLGGTVIRGGGRLKEGD